MQRLSDKMPTREADGSLTGVLRQEGHQAEVGSGCATPADTKRRTLFVDVYLA